MLCTGLNQYSEVFDLGIGHNRHKDIIQNEYKPYVDKRNRNEKQLTV